MDLIIYRVSTELKGNPSYRGTRPHVPLYLLDPCYEVVSYIYNVTLFSNTQLKSLLVSSLVPTLGLPFEPLDLPRFRVRILKYSRYVFSYFHTLHHLSPISLI
jgi:hypothetical protein